VDINQVIYKNGETILFYECRRRNKDLIEYLVENGADINKENEFGEIPLFYSCRSGNKSIV